MRVFAALISLTCLALPLSLNAAEELKAGDKAPDFEMKGSDGKTHKLADYAGKQAVVIAWFPKAFTGGCTAECKSLRDSGDAVRAYNVAYFAASTDTPDDNKKFAESLTLDFPILSDPTKEVAEKYGVLNKERGLASRWTIYIGKNGRILAIDKEVKTGSHGKDVAVKLGELRVDRR